MCWTNRVGKKAAKEEHHLWVGMRELDRVAPLGTLGPVEHAAGLVERIAFPRHTASILLPCEPSGAALRGPARRPPPYHLGVLRAARTEHVEPLLVGGEPNVLGPGMDRTW